MVPLSKYGVNTYFCAFQKYLGCFLTWIAGYLQPAQDDDVQLPQPELPPEGSVEEALEDRPMPKRDISLLVFFDPHFSQPAAGFDPVTSFSKSAPHALQ
jgi:hypothetical protein